MIVKLNIGKELISSVEDELGNSLKIALRESVPRKLDSVILSLRSNYGESYIHTFKTLDQVLKFIEKFDEEEDMDTTDSPVLLI